MTGAPQADEAIQAGDVVALKSELHRVTGPKMRMTVTHVSGDGTKAGVHWFHDGEMRFDEIQIVALRKLGNL